MRQLLCLLLLCLAPLRAVAADWDALRQAGAHAIMRHALAPGTGDPADFVLNDCSTQRNLDTRGRAQAQDVGESLREAGIVFDRILTSQWCRTRETAALLNLGRTEDAPALNSFFQDVSTREQQTAATRALIAGAEGRMMMVTHQVNITALTGVVPRSGEVLVIREEGGEIRVVARILIAP